jgi:transposase
MIQITPQMRILVAVEAVDGRKGIDSLARLCQEKLEADPFSGWLFVFRSRRGTAIRILVYDGQGFWLAQKRLSKGRFRWWPEGRSRHERWRGVWRRINCKSCWRRATRALRKRRRRGGR